MQSREAKFKKAMKLKAMAESTDFSGNKNKSERALAKLKFEKMTMDEGYKPLEIHLGKLVEFNRGQRPIKSSSYLYYIQFWDCLPEFIEVMPKNPLFGSYYIKSDLSFPLRVDVRDKPLNSKVNIPDPCLKKIIRESLGLKEFKFRDLLRVKKLRLKDSSIESLSGLEYCKNLQSIDLRVTCVSDISPLESLYGLKKCLMRGSAVKDLTPLSNCFELQKVDVKLPEFFRIGGKI